MCWCACKTHVLCHSEDTRFSIFGQVVRETHTHTQTHARRVCVCTAAVTHIFSSKLLEHSACRFDDYIFASLCSIFPFVKRNHRNFCSFFSSFCHSSCFILCFCDCVLYRNDKIHSDFCSILWKKFFFVAPSLSLSRSLRFAYRTEWQIKK